MYKRHEDASPGGDYEINRCRTVAENIQFSQSVAVIDQSHLKNTLSFFRFSERGGQRIAHAGGRGAGGGRSAF